LSQATEPIPVYPRADVAVVGAGAAGLYVALVAAGQGASVRLISSSPLSESASYRAQGGLAAALGDDDSAARHLADTLCAGRGTARKSAARLLCDDAPERVRELERRGVHFDATPEGDLMLGLEGGHSRRRIVHAGGSATGRQVASVLSAAALDERRIDVHERSSAVGLWVENGRCVGVLTADGAMSARTTVLATGGAAALWRRTTNPQGARGSGLVLAHRAGAALADMELLQFHPTALVSDTPHDGFLITEAVRGEGALLVTAEGERFVDELAPRDEVARAVHDELVRSGRDSVYLDMRGIDLGGFPNIVQVLAETGIDPAQKPVPVAPAAHYMVGGIVSDGDGRSTLDGLYAVGECACTGMHGANRLASNSLSECFVFGRRAALAAAGEGGAGPSQAPPAAEPVERVGDDLRSELWERAGIVREKEGLRGLAAHRRLLARLIGRAALEREESRGCHIRSDFPHDDTGLDRVHFVFGQGEEHPRAERWD
jgi:L-aspartate oxidase